MQEWFYHAPARRSEDTPAVEYPAPSQIPLLSGVELDGTDVDFGAKRGYYKESDTKYIRLAKQGGRKDLLRFRSPKTLSEEPVPYPRPDWLDWNETPDADAGPRQVYMPDYMVYEEHQADPDSDPYYPKRPPYSLHDNVSVFKRDGGKATDKTVRLPEIKRPHKRHTFQKKVENNKPAGMDQPGKRQQPTNRPGMDESEPVAFNKLLSMGYQKDWVQEREKYYNKQQSVADQRRKLAPAQGVTVSEYQEAIGKGMEKHTPTQTQRRTRVSASSEKKQVPLEDDKLFKLSKFNKIPAKVNTRRDDQTYPAHHMQSSQPQPMEA